MYRVLRTNRGNLSKGWQKYEEMKSWWDKEEKQSGREVWKKEKMLRKWGKAEYDINMKKRRVVEKRRKSRLWPPLQCHTRTPSVDWTCHTPPPDCDHVEVQYEEDGGDDDDGDRDDDEVQYDKDDHGDDIDGSSHNLEGKSVLFAARCSSWLLPGQGRDLGIHVQFSSFNFPFSIAPGIFRFTCLNLHFYAVHSSCMI